MKRRVTRKTIIHRACPDRCDCCMCFEQVPPGRDVLRTDLGLFSHVTCMPCAKSIRAALNVYEARGK